jgi:ribonuclease BN (tRNA processing enzyme)
MRIVLLGSGGYYANDRRHTAGILLPELGVLLDAGTSLYRLPSRLKTRHLQIFLSHAHLDHVVGLTYLLAPMCNGQLQQVQVHGRHATLQAVQHHLFAPALFPKQPGFRFLPLEGPVELADGGIVSHVPLTQHPGGSVGYRIDWKSGSGAHGKSLAYITDTCVDGSYTQFVRGVDLLIHECYFPDDSGQMASVTGHSSTSAVAQVAQDAGVGRLVLVHIDPRRTDDDPINIGRAREIFANTEIAEDLMEIDLQQGQGNES